MLSPTGPTKENATTTQVLNLGVTESTSTLPEFNELAKVLGSHYIPQETLASQAEEKISKEAEQAKRERDEQDIKRKLKKRRSNYTKADLISTKESYSALLDAKTTIVDLTEIEDPIDVVQATTWSDAIDLTQEDDLANFFDNGVESKRIPILGRKETTKENACVEIHKKTEAVGLHNEPRSNPQIGISVSSDLQLNANQAPEQPVSDFVGNNISNHNNSIVQLTRNNSTQDSQSKVIIISDGEDPCSDSKAEDEDEEEWGGPLSLITEDDRYEYQPDLEDVETELAKNGPDNTFTMANNIADDSDAGQYKNRVMIWSENRASYRAEPIKTSERKAPHPSYPDGQLENRGKVPGDIYHNLLEYQREGVNWLWNLYRREQGGILADEMGLGKTIQAIAFLAALYYSSDCDRPSVIVCPATLSQQWVAECHKWWAPLRVINLHLSKKYSIDPATFKRGTLFIMSYEGMFKAGCEFLNRDWGCVFLDEGHKIANPETRASKMAKLFKTPYRFILSGTPIQNRLKELWSLYEFVRPGMLGTLDKFNKMIAKPIELTGTRGTVVHDQSLAAARARSLRSKIESNILRRTKAQLDLGLPKKSDNVLLCQLQPEQYSAYTEYLNSLDLPQNLLGREYLMGAITTLRKICNHPDLARISYKSNHNERNISYIKDTSSYLSSGKMRVLDGLLRMWQPKGHRVLIFCQTIQSQELILNMDFLRGATRRDHVLAMNGNTPAKERMALVDKFNNNDAIFAFVMTTRTGGLGLNLTSADRVVVFDPDWNPSVDNQAVARVWRLGQKKEVGIYRLLTAGTIEEKVHHLQLYKQILSDRILKDPQQKLLFKNQLDDLFEFPPNPESEQVGSTMLACQRKTESDGDVIVLDESPVPELESQTTNTLVTTHPSTKTEAELALSNAKKIDEAKSEAASSLSDGDEASKKNNDPNHKHQQAMFGILGLGGNEVMELEESDQTKEEREKLDQYAKKMMDEFLSSVKNSDNSQNSEFTVQPNQPRPMGMAWVRDSNGNLPVASDRGLHAKKNSLLPNKPMLSQHSGCYRGIKRSSCCATPYTRPNPASCSSNGANPRQKMVLGKSSEIVPQRQIANPVSHRELPGVTNSKLRSGVTSFNKVVRGPTSTSKQVCQVPSKPYDRFNQPPPSRYPQLQRLMKNHKDRPSTPSLVEPSRITNNDPTHNNNNGIFLTTNQPLPRPDIRAPKNKQGTTNLLSRFHLDKKR